MSPILQAENVRRPLSLKIFGIALVLLILMICVTVLSSVNLRRVGQQLDFLSRFYIELDQMMGDVRAYGLGELILVERILQNKPQLSIGVARQEAGERKKEIGECGTGSIRSAIGKIRQARPATGDQQLVVYEFIKLCASEKLSRASQLINEALSLDLVKEDSDQVAVFSQLRQELKDVPTARAKLHAAFEKYIGELRAGESRVLDVIRAQMDENRAEVSRKISDVTNVIHAGTRDSAARAISTEQKVQWLSWIITIIACALGLMFAAYVTRTLVRPMRDLMTGTKAIEQGNLDVQINIKTADEIAQLADSFNHMVAKLRQKEAIQDMFGKYVDPRVVQGLLDGQQFAQSGERRVMTVFFSDLEGFTVISEQLTPSGVVRLLNQYFTLMAEPIRANRGIIDKYIGDSVMAFWGPPFTQETDHAGLACYAALEQQARVPKFQELLPEVLGIRKGVPTIRVRMALVTGDVTVGSIGSEEARSYTVIGDTVNLASRLESANKLYHTQIIISEDTRNLAKDGIEARELDSICVVGKSDPVRVYELLGLKGNISSDVIELRDHFENSLRLYRDRKWDDAQGGFKKCLKINPEDGPSLLFLERIRHLKEHPPVAEWDGVWTLSEK